MKHSFYVNAFVSFACSPEKRKTYLCNCCCCCSHFVVRVFVSAMLQDGGNGGVTSPESRRLEGLKGGVGDGGEAQRGARHPGDIIEAA